MGMSIGISLTAMIVDEDEDEQTSCALNGRLRVVANANGYC